MASLTLVRGGDRQRGNWGMTEEKKAAFFWAEISPAQRRVVYSLMNKALADVNYRSDEKELLAGKAEASHSTLSDAFIAAIMELEMNDPFFCADCCEVHEAEEMHPTKSSGVSS